MVKLSVSLSESDLAVIDAFARKSGLASRSAVLRHAIGLLRQADLEAEHMVAWGEWDTSGDHAVWEETVGDGV